MSFGKRLLTAALSMALTIWAAHGIAAAADRQPWIGFNQNWSQLPALSSPGMIDNIRALAPRMIRYPGGTVTHSWDWRAGVITTRAPKAAHPVGDLGTLAKATGARVVVVLDIVNRSLADQIEMLRAIRKQGITIGHVELGNELYAQDKGYETTFPSGKDYATRVRAWVPKLKAAFPGVKISAVLLGRPVGPANARGAEWNTQVVAGTRTTVDAFTYHIYISPTETAAQTIARFEQVASAAGTGAKELWITEYGTQHDPASKDYLSNLAQLADYVEKRPGVTIALNHQIVAGDQMTKLTPDGTTFTPEGRLFVARAKARP